MTNVAGYKRLPDPPARMIPFMLQPLAVHCLGRIELLLRKKIYSVMPPSSTNHLASFYFTLPVSTAIYSRGFLVNSTCHPGGLMGTTILSFLASSLTWSRHRKSVNAGH